MHRAFEHAERGVGLAMVHAWEEAAQAFQAAIMAFQEEPAPINSSLGMPERYWPAIWAGRRVAVMMLRANGGILDEGLRKYLDDGDATRSYCAWTCEQCRFHDCVMYLVQGAG